MHGKYFEIPAPKVGFGTSSSGLFTAGEVTYNHDEMKTINPPGTVSGVIEVPEITGERKRSIPVATAVAKHLITASASSAVRNQNGEPLMTQRENLHL
jgi:hypothetical protein